MKLPQVAHRFASIDGVRVFYREAGPPGAPSILLLHGFPSSSQQYRRLIDALADRYHVIAPDYPGFGHSDAPPRREFVYSFDRLADVVERFCASIGLNRFYLYTFDFGGPVGLRIATRRPEWIAGLVVQNANAYEEGLSPMARDFAALKPGVAGAAERARAILTLEMTKNQWLGGTARPELISPDAWTLDQHFLDQPGRAEIQVDLALDYHTNVARYPEWQAWLRRSQPPMLVAWGKNDPFFLEAGARAYRR